MNDWLQHPLFPYVFGLGCGLFAFILGWVIGHLLGTHREKARAAAALAQAEAKASADLASVNAKLEILREQRQTLLDDFKSLSIATLVEQSDRTEKSQQEKLNALLEPLRGDMESFRLQLSQDHASNLQKAGALGQQLSTLGRLSQDAASSAQSLAAALRGSTNIRGRWGETTLENLLELAGLPKGVAYQRQVSMAADGLRQRPDVVVALPGERYVIIDAKAVLSHYLDYVQAADETARATAAKAHAAALRTQVKDLSRRAYESLPGIAGHAPDFVLLFVPSEPAYALALDTDPKLFEEAAQLKVLPVSPATLLAALRIIELLWRAENQYAAVDAVYTRLGAIYAKYASFAEELQTLSDALDRARAAYDRAFALLSTGKGNLVRQMQLFLAHLPPQRKSLPQPFADAASIPQESDHEV